MIHPVSGRPTRRHLVAALALVLLVTVCWYAVQPVYPECVFFGTSVEQAVESGQCPPPETRWRTWVR